MTGGLRRTSQTVRARCTPTPTAVVTVTTSHDSPASEGMTSWKIWQPLLPALRYGLRCQGAPACKKTERVALDPLPSATITPTTDFTAALPAQEVLALRQLLTVLRAWTPLASAEPR